MDLSRLRQRVRYAFHNVRLNARDTLHNARCPRRGKRILVVRHRDRHCGYNDHFLRWVAQQAPEAVHLFELQRVPCHIRNWQRYTLFLPWLQDPLKEKLPHVYQHVKQIEMQCQKYSIPVANPVDTLSNSIKSVATRIINNVGIRTPRMVPITEIESFKQTQGGLSTPFFIREDKRHGGQIFMIHDPQDLQGVPFSEFAAPVAVEFIDVQDKDGFYRKYRYIAIGDDGIPRHMITSASWEVRAEMRIINKVTVAEELAYLSGEDPNHHVLQRARKALGFDFVAFDYSYDTQGCLVVWEPNPFPILWTAASEQENMRHVLPTMDRLYTKLLDYYLRRANLSSAIPSGVVDTERKVLM